MGLDGFPLPNYCRTSTDSFYSEIKIQLRTSFMVPSGNY